MTENTKPNSELIDETPREVREAFDALITLEDRRNEMLRRAELQDQAADMFSHEVSDAEDAASSAEASAIVDGGADADAAASAAQRRVSDLQVDRAKRDRNAEVLRAEAAKLEPEIAEARTAAFSAAHGALTSIASDAAAEFERRIADLVPELRRQAMIIDTCARLEGGFTAATSLSVSREMTRLERAIEIAGAPPKSWRDADDPKVEAVRSVAAYSAPDPSVIQTEWVDGELEERFSERRSAYIAEKQAELERRQAAASQRHTNYVAGNRHSAPDSPAAA